MKPISFTTALSKESFAPFGQAILGADESPNYSGGGWTSLFPAGKADLPKGELGWVRTTQPKNLLITGMERHPDPEVLWTVTEPLIQAVAPPGDLTIHTEQPISSQVKAFLILPGQVIIMSPATWHAPAFPASKEVEALYYFIGVDHPREPGWEDTPWIPFSDAKAITISLPEKA